MTVFGLGEECGSRWARMPTLAAKCVAKNGAPSFYRFWEDGKDNGRSLRDRSLEVQREDLLFAGLNLFAGCFLMGFFFPPFELLVEVEGLTMGISFVAMGEPRPVQASQPGPAEKPMGEPE
jgi:hypothetical protein